MKKPFTIYVIDDNRFNLKMIKKQLKDQVSSNVWTFTRAEDCLRATQFTQPDLVLSDYRLTSSPNLSMNGDDLLRKFKQDHPKIPVIMYSSINSLNLAVRMMKDGADKFIKGEENFLEKVAKAATQKVHSIRAAAQERFAKRSMGIGIVVVSATMLSLHQWKPDLLPLFALTFLATLIGLVIFSDPITKFLNKNL